MIQIISGKLDEVDYAKALYSESKKSLMKKDLEKEVKKLVDINCREKGYVCAVDILLQLDYLTKKDYEDWRFGRVEYLEKVCKINLSQLSQIYKLLQKCAIDLSVKASWTGYNQYGKGI